MITEPEGEVIVGVLTSTNRITKRHKIQEPTVSLPLPARTIAARQPHTAHPGRTSPTYEIL